MIHRPGGQAGGGWMWRGLRGLPTAITLARLVVVPWLVWVLLAGDHAAAFWLFVAAGLSDAIDGALARWLNARTALGAWLDALADKVLLVGIYVAGAVVGLVPVWLAVLVLARDAAIIVSVLVLSRRLRDLQADPLLISKINTAVQIIFAAWVLAGAAGTLPAILTGFGDGLIAAVAMTTMTSWLAYAIRGRVLMKTGERR